MVTSNAILGPSGMWGPRAPRPAVDEPQPGADADGFGGDAPEPADGHPTGEETFDVGQPEAVEVSTEIEPGTPDAEVENIDGEPADLDESTQAPAEDADTDAVDPEPAKPLSRRERRALKAQGDAAPQ